MPADASDCEKVRLRVRVEAETTYWTSLHGERLAGASLPICKDADVVAIRTTLRQHGDFFEYFSLR